MRSFALAVFVLSWLSFHSPADPREPLVGVWTGDSICTAVRPACRDEKAAYHVVLSDRADSVSMTMNKIVDGKEETMGTLVYQVDPDARTLRSEVDQNGLHTLWSFAWSGPAMRGTLKLLPSGDVVRNITLRKR